MADCILPLDMILCILSRLPVKSLVRFKSICKSWQEQVSNPKFIKIHYEQFSLGPKTSSTKQHSLSNVIMEPLSKMIRGGHPTKVFIDCCEGLVCMGRPMYGKDIVLWNPATNQWKTLPHSEAEFGNLEMVSLGFGYKYDADDGGYDYRVVRLLGLNGKKLRSGVEVYSSKTDSWKTLQVTFKFKMRAFVNSAIVNGTPYWEALIGDEGKERYVLLGIGFDGDCANIEFKIVPIPPSIKLKCGTFVDWKGSLGRIMCMKNDDDWLESIDAWVYDDGECVWTRKESYGAGKLKLRVDGRYMNVSKNGKIYGSCMNDDFFIYNTETNHLEVILDLKKDIQRIPYHIFPYEESLEFVKGMMPMVVRKEDRKQEHINITDGCFISCLNDPNGADIRCYYALGC